MWYCVVSLLVDEDFVSVLERTFGVDVRTGVAEGIEGMEEMGRRDEGGSGLVR